MAFCPGFFNTEQEFADILTSLNRSFTVSTFFAQIVVFVVENSRQIFVGGAILFKIITHNLV